MPRETVYLDRDHRVVPASVAEIRVTTTTDADGFVVDERWEEAIPEGAGPEERFLLFQAQRSADRPWIRLAAGGMMLMGTGTLVAVSGVGPPVLAVGLSAIGVSLGGVALWRLLRPTP